MTVFTVFRLLTNFVCLYNYEFWLSLCKIVQSSVILLLPLLFICLAFWVVLFALLLLSLGLVSCAPNIASFSGFFILDIPFIRRLLTKRSLIKSFLIASYVFILIFLGANQTWFLGKAEKLPFSKQWTRCSLIYLYSHFIRVITKLPNSEQSYKRKVKTHNYINRQNQSTTGKLWKP